VNILIWYEYSNSSPSPPSDIKFFLTLFDETIRRGHLEADDLHHQICVLDPSLLVPLQVCGCRVFLVKNYSTRFPRHLRRPFSHLVSLAPQRDNLDHQVCVLDPSLLCEYLFNTFP